MKKKLFGYLAQINLKTNEEKCRHASNGKASLILLVENQVHKSILNVMNITLHISTYVQFFTHVRSI